MKFVTQVIIVLLLGLLLNTVWSKAQMMPAPSPAPPRYGPDETPRPSPYIHRPRPDHFIFVSQDRTVMIDGDEISSFQMVAGNYIHVYFKNSDNRVSMKAMEKDWQNLATILQKRGNLQ